MSTQSLFVGIVALFGFGAGVGYLWGGWTAVFAVLLLALLEVSLSFDNAVVNAAVLKRMSPKWQNRFLTWGIPIAVFGTRFLFPLLIVAVVAHLNPIEVLKLAFINGEAYGHELEKAHVAIASFGGTFLLMVFFSFFLNSEKHIHWVHVLEKGLARLGRLESMPIIAGIFTLLTFSYFLDKETAQTVVESGLWGLLIYILINSFTSFLEQRESAVVASQAGLSLFIYLQFLDTSFSLDSVIGAFAISTDILVIAIGLGIGAFAVRSITLFLVRRETLSHYLYLEHGAHYAIGALAFLMLLGIPFNIPEIVTGTIGILFIGATFLSSVLEKKVR